MSYNSDPIEQLISEATTDEARFFVGSLLAGRYIAAADEIITSSEAEVFEETAKMALNIHDKEMIQTLLHAAVVPGYRSNRDLERIAELTDNLGEAAWLHIFCFACQIAGTNEELHVELPLLEDLATIWAIPIKFKDILYANLIDRVAGLAGEPQYFDELIDALHPEELTIRNFGPSISEIALTNVRQLKLQRDQQRSAAEIGALGKHQRQELTTASALISSLEDSPARNMVFDVASRLQGLPRQILPRQVLESAQRMENISHDDVFRIAVVGSFSSGKSTFLNALCGKGDIFPTSTIPCTGALSILRYADEPAYWKRLNDGLGTEVEIDERAFRELVELPDDIARAEHLATSDLDALIVEHPLQICQHGVEIIDSPGLNENPQRTRITEQYLKSSDAVIYIMAVRQLASEQDREQIKNLIEQIGDKHLFFVINSFDEVAGDPDEEQKVINRARSYFKSIYPDNFEGQFSGRVHFLSALQVTRERNQEGPSSRFIEDFEAFENALGQYLAGAKGKTRWRHKADELMRILANAYQHVEAQALSLENTSDLQEQRKTKERALQRIRRSREQIESAMEGAQRTIEESAEKIWEELGQSFGELKDQLPNYLSEQAYNWESDGNPLWGKKQIQQDFSTQYQDDLRGAITYWSEEHAQRILNEQLQKMIRRLNRDFQEIQQTMQELNTLSDSAFQMSEQDDDSGAFMTFMRAAGGFAAGGPLGALVGATMDWEDVAFNAGANFAAGLTLAALGVGTGVLIPAVALFGAAQALWGAANAKEDIRAKVFEAGMESLDGVLAAVGDNLSSNLYDTFEELIVQVDTVVEHRYKQFEELAQEQLRQLEEIENNEAQRKEEAAKKRQLAAAIREWSTELEPFASVETEKLFVKPSKRQARRLSKMSELGLSTEDEWDYLEESNSSIWLVILLLVILIGIGALWFLT